MSVTPQARAVAALALAVTVILGSWNGVGVGLLGLGPDALYQGQASAVFARLVPLMVAVLAFSWAKSETGTDRWDIHLAGAARVLAVVAMARVAIEMLGDIVQSL